MQRFATAKNLCCWHVIIVSPLGTHFPYQCVFRAVVQCSERIIPHWGTIFTSTPAGPMFAANFCPTGAEVGCSALPRHWRGSRYLLPAEADYHFGPTGAEVRSDRGNSVPLGHNFRADHTLVEMGPQWDPISLCSIHAPITCVFATSVPPAHKLKCGPGGSE